MNVCANRADLDFLGNMFGMGMLESVDRQVSRCPSIFLIDGATESFNPFFPLSHAVSMS